MSNYLLKLISTLVIVFVAIPLFAGGEWYKLYDDGLEAMQRGDYMAASNFFRQALQGNPEDKEKVRTYGMHFIEYFPNRELGICQYHLGNMQEARKYLNISMGQAATQRAQQYMSKIKQGKPPRTKPDKDKPKVGMLTPGTGDDKTGPNQPPLYTGNKTVKLVGDRMTVAIFPFENRGASRDLGEIVLDKMITVLYNQDRFELMERDKLNRVLAEHALGQSGVIDAASAAEIGKGIGVDAIILGSVAAATTGALNIDARVIDTESAAIIGAQDAFSGGADIQSVKNAVENLARKIIEDLPLVDGYVIKIEGDKYILDKGRNSGLRKGMKCTVYREGRDIIHPITGEVQGQENEILGEILITDASENLSTCRPLEIKLGANISIGNKFITK